MGSVDHWDTESHRHMSAYLLAHGREISARFPGRLLEAITIVRRHATSWAKECREMAMPPPDDGRTVWQYRMRQAEAEIANTLPAIPVMPTEQAGLFPTAGQGS